MLLAIENIPFVYTTVKERLDNQKVRFKLHLTLLKTFCSIFMVIQM